MLLYETAIIIVKRPMNPDNVKKNKYIRYNDCFTLFAHKSLFVHKDKQYIRYDDCLCHLKKTITKTKIYDTMTV